MPGVNIPEGREATAKGRPGRHRRRLSYHRRLPEIAREVKRGVTARCFLEQFWEEDFVEWNIKYLLGREQTEMCCFFYIGVASLGLFVTDVS